MNPHFFILEKVPLHIQYYEDQALALQYVRDFLQKKVQSLRGQSNWSVSLPRLREEILKEPWIKNVALKRSWPNKLSLNVDLHRIVFLYIDGKNRIYPISDTGKLLGPVSATQTLLAPIVRNPKIIENTQRRMQVLNLFEKIVNSSILKWDNVAQVNLLPTTGLTLDLIKDRQRVHLGWKNIGLKSSQVLRVADYLKSQNQKARIIDASFPKKVLVRLRKGT